MGYQPCFCGEMPAHPVHGLVSRPLEAATRMEPDPIHGYKPNPIDDATEQPIFGDFRDLDCEV